MSRLGFLSLSPGNEHQVKHSNVATTTVFPGTKTLGACGLGNAAGTGTESPEQAYGACSVISGLTAQPDEAHLFEGLASHRKG